MKVLTHHNHEGSGVVYCSGCGYTQFDRPLCGCQCPRHHRVKQYGCQVEATERTNARPVTLDGGQVLMCRSCAEAWNLMAAREFASAASAPVNRGDIVAVEGVARECTVRAVGNAGKDVYVVEDPRSNNGTWVAIEQVRKVRDGQ